MARQWFVPEYGQLNDKLGIEFFLPDYGGFVEEGIAQNIAGSVLENIIIDGNG